MYHKQPIPIPQNTGKIVRVKSGTSTYVYYQTGRVYNSKKKYNSATRTTIGKVSASDSSMMYPNDKYYQYFSDIPYNETVQEPERSCAIRIGAYAVIDKIIKELKLREMLSDQFKENDINFLLDLATYSIITENNAGQYYPMYAYEHALFTTKMNVYSDSTLSKWLRSVTASQIISSMNKWNSMQNHKDKVYVSYDSTNKNSQAGDVEFVEYGAAKNDVGLPIINYSMAYDITERIPLFYESYPGSIPDVAQFSCMVEKAKGYGYKNIGFILDRGYFSEKNIKHLDTNKYAFIIMVKGRKKLVRSIIEENFHTFEKKSRYYIEEYDLFGCTVERKLFESDEKSRYIHLYHSSSKEAAEINRLNDTIRKMKKEMDKAVGKEVTIPKAYAEYFTLYYNDIEEVKNLGKKGETVETRRIFTAYEENEDVVERYRNLCGYFAIATSEKKTAKEALLLYESRDMSEKLFRGDKSYLGDKSMRTHSTESTETKIFVEFIALIIRARIYTRLSDFNIKQVSKMNYMTVPAAIKELEKIMMIHLPDGRYHLSYAVTKTQKNILSAFGMSEEDITNTAKNIADLLQEENNGKTQKTHA